MRGMFALESGGVPGAVRSGRCYLCGEFAECCVSSVFVVSAASCAGQYLCDLILVCW